MTGRHGGTAVLVAVLLVAAAACSTGGAAVDGAGSDVGTASSDAGACGELADPARRPLDGFGEVAFVVVAPGGATTAGCALLAATDEARAQGLMGQRDLRGYDAMVFRFGEPVTGRFYMYRTVVPLSIAFVAADGRVVSTADMAPCEAQDPGACPTFGAAEPYLHALEVLAGDLDALGLVPGATVTYEEGGTGGA